MVQFTLNHTCHKAGCKGEKGQTIEVTEENAAWLEAHGGGKRVGSKPAAKVVETEQTSTEQTEQTSEVLKTSEVSTDDEPADETNAEGTNDENSGDSEPAAPRKRKRGQ